MTAILDGLKVIDCGSFIAAAIAGTVMADFGADVIKIEPPGTGDAYRHVAHARGMPTSEHNYPWLLDNRSKRGLALNLASPAGQNVLHTLVKQADVFITNQPLGVRKKLRTDYETLAALNDRLIYASFTGYGETGAESSKPGFDLTAYWARSGLMDQVVPHAGATPARALSGMGDHPSGVSLFSAIMLALYQRERTGRGAHVGSSLIANGVWANGVWAQAALCGATFLPRPPREQSYNALSCYYRCRDGGWLLLALVNEDKHWPVLAKCLGREELASDSRFSDRAGRSKNATTLIAELDAAFATRDSADWRALFMANGLVFEAVATMDQVANDPQMRETDVLLPFEGDTMLTINSPFFVTGADKAAPRKPPDLGEHNEQILREAGYDDAAIAQLRADEAIG
ncbi:MAG: CoA transferase [Xanthobacteraceae bacterium]|nr:CoA transferase [Xanthobacteraceae bacterium]